MQKSLSGRGSSLLCSITLAFIQPAVLFHTKEEPNSTPGLTIKELTFMPFKSSSKLVRYKSHNKIILPEYLGKVSPVLKYDRPCKDMKLAYNTQQILTQALDAQEESVSRYERLGISASGKEKSIAAARTRNPGVQVITLLTEIPRVIITLVQATV